MPHAAHRQRRLDRRTARGRPRQGSAPLVSAPGAVLGGLALLLVVASGCAIAFGSVSVPAGPLVRALLGLPVGPRTASIVLAIRLPRVVMAALAGCALAQSGAVLQGLFRNPLADPGLLGVSSGAGFAAVCAIALGLEVHGLWILPLCAFAGAILATATVYVLAVRRGRMPVLTLILAGVAVSALFAAGTTLVLTVSALSQNVLAMLNWLFGGLNGILWRQDATVAPFVLLGGAAMCLFGRELNLLAAGEEGAAALGVPVEPVRRMLLALTALVTAAAVAAAGPIAFVGLMVPHMLRLLIGADHRLLLPASMLGGASFLVLADLVARVVVRPGEINLGVVTALVGVPFFLYLLRRATRGGDAL